jgi:L-asparagine transporter-like permease
MEMQKLFIEAEAEMQRNVTERWRQDMKSDSWLSKNVRPMVLIFLVVCTVLMIFIDAGTISFNVEEKWTSLLEVILMVVIGSYFGGRTFEKIKK